MESLRGTQNLIENTIHDPFDAPWLVAATLCLAVDLHHSINHKVWIAEWLSPPYDFLGPVERHRGLLTCGGTRCSLHATPDKKKKKKSALESRRRVTTLYLITVRRKTCWRNERENVRKSAPDPSDLTTPCGDVRWISRVPRKATCVLFSSCN